MSRDRRRQYGTGGVHQRSSDGRWIGTIEAGWTTNGTRRRVTVSAKTEAECRRKLQAKQKQIAAEGPPAERSRRTTVKAWADEWLPMHAARVRPKTYATDASAVRRWIVPTIGSRLLADVSPSDVRRLTNAIRDADRSTTTARYVQGVLRRMLQAARVEGHEVPVRALETPSPGRAASDRDAVSTDDARAILIRAAELDDGSRWVAALLQGMRQGECLGLTWDAVDLDGGTLDISWQLQSLPYLSRENGTFRVPDGHESRQLHGALHLVRPKSQHGRRVIPLVPWMSAALTRWRRLSPANEWGLVWPVLRPARGGRIVALPQTSRADREAWEALQERAGVAHPSGRPYLLHEARHATATLLLEAGVSEAVIIAIMGHSSIVTTRGYQHVSQALARRALDDVAQRLGLPAS